MSRSRTHFTYNVTTPMKHPEKKSFQKTTHLRCAMTSRKFFKKHTCITQDKGLSVKTMLYDR